MIPQSAIETLLTIHVAVSLIGIVSGLTAMIALGIGRWRTSWQLIFLANTILTSLTGFLFPFTGVTPAFTFGLISLAVLAVALIAWPRPKASPETRIIYVVSATFALFLNIFVLVVQAFQKIDVLQPLAPTQSEPAFFIAQGIVLIGIITIGTLAVCSARQKTFG